jgi:putative transposase
MALLQVPRKRPRKRIAATARPCPQAPTGPNQTETDEFTKEGLAIDVDGRIRSARVIEELSRLVSARRPRLPAQ